MVLWCLACVGSNCDVSAQLKHTGSPLQPLVWDRPTLYREQAFSQGFLLKISSINESIKEQKNRHHYHLIDAILPVGSETQAGTGSGCSLIFHHLITLNQHLKVGQCICKKVEGLFFNQLRSQGERHAPMWVASKETQRVHPR